MQGKEVTYKEIREFNYPGMRIKVYIPDLTEDERNRRLKLIHNSAAALLKNRST